MGVAVAVAVDVETGALDDVTVLVTGAGAVGLMAALDPEPETTPAAAGRAAAGAAAAAGVAAAGRPNCQDILLFGLLRVKTRVSGFDQI